MKHSNDIFIPVNPNSPRKRRRKKSNSHGNVINFGSTGLASESDSPRLIRDENQPCPILGSPWAPVSNFRTWEPSEKAIPISSTTPTHSSRVDLSSVPSQSPPILLTLRNTENNQG